MDASPIVPACGIVAAAFLLLRPKDIVPMLISVALIVLGTVLVVWLYTHRGAYESFLNSLDAVDNILINLSLILLVQILFLPIWWLIKRRTGPYRIERKDDAGNWHKITTTPSYRTAKRLAHDSHRRVVNLNGDCIYVWASGRKEIVIGKE